MPAPICARGPVPVIWLLTVRTWPDEGLKPPPLFVTVIPRKTDKETGVAAVPI